MNLYDLLKWFAQPVVRIVLALLGPIGLILGCIANPQGAVNSFVCRIIDVVASVWPSTPDSMKLGNLIMSSSSDLTVGQAVIQDLFQTAFLMLTIMALVKVYKLIPFKAT